MEFSVREIAKLLDVSKSSYADAYKCIKVPIEKNSWRISPLPWLFSDIQDGFFPTKKEIKLMVGSLLNFVLFPFYFSFIQSGSISPLLRDKRGYQPFNILGRPLAQDL